ncbi:hypothetical protein K0M31_001153 [Melipona bicolor]|uniref:Uncharacterized protein n=1 Tax=Melipona bicolor TaxID=60889 RepID=A0AA40KXX8_9HYME|nr:hypothetical protein K0M31_001153 [Melipona bicolor]
MNIKIVKCSEVIAVINGALQNSYHRTYQPNSVLTGDYIPEESNVCSGQDSISQPAILYENYTVSTRWFYSLVHPIFAIVKLQFHPKIY